MFTYPLRKTMSTTNDRCPGISPEHIDAAQTIWNYMKVDDPLEKSDIIIGLGSHDVRVALRAVELWKQGLAEFILFSGKSGVLTKGKWRKSEAEIFQDVAIEHGVPKTCIFVETNSTNTGENIRFSYQILSEMQRLPTKVILVQKPYMGRRTLATFQKQWPGSNCSVFVTSPKIDLLNYPNDDVGGLDNVITVLMGDMQRMDHYVKLGFQTYQHIPEYVWSAYNILLSSGLYNNHLV